MKKMVVAWALLVCSALAQDAKKNPDPFAGVWEGTSLCQYRPSACKDEHVIYEISSTGPGQEKIDAYKIVNGEKDYMGDLSCKVVSPEKLVCADMFHKNEYNWEYVRSGDKISGELHVEIGGARQLFRKIAIERKH